MKISATNRGRLVVSLLSAVVVALLGLSLLVPDWRPGERLALASYDSLHRWSGEVRLPNCPVVLLYLDLPTYLHEQRDPAQPWPRELHAEAVRKLKAAGARAIVFDIVFSRAGPSADADRDFAQAIREDGQVVLAAEYNNKASSATSDDTVGAQLAEIDEAYAPFVQAAASVGIATFAVDRDRAVRRYKAGFSDLTRPSLAWATATLVDAPSTRSRDAMEEANRKWVRYYGPPLALPHVSYKQLFETNGVPDGFFRDKIVLIGSRPMVGLPTNPQDEFGNPFDRRDVKELFTPGVEVHATELLNAIRADFLRRLPPALEAMWILAAAVIFGPGLIWLRPTTAAVVSIVGIATIVAAAVSTFNHGVWFPYLVVVGVQLPAAFVGAGLYYTVEWARARTRFEAAKKIADAKIREQAALIEKAHDAIFVQSLEGKIIFANASAQRLYGYEGKDFDPNHIFAVDAKAAATARQTALDVGEWNGELKQQTKSGKTITVASRWTLIRDDHGQPTALLMLNTDITEQKLLEQQFLRTQRMNTIGSLAGGMAHDLNNALAPILMGAQLLRRKTDDPESRNLLAMMEMSTHRGADMVRQVLLFARGRGGEFERLQLGSLVKELQKMVRETFPKNVEIETFVPSDLAPVQGNVTQLYQVLLNLCVNARDAMPNGGKLSIAVDNAEYDSNGKAGPFVSIMVSDTGTGMPPEVIAKIFDPFFTTKGEGRGTGIGLSTVDRIVKNHGGLLRVESKPGEGTSFEIFLPCAPEISAETKKKKTEKTIARGHGELILVADDEEVIRELVAAELTAFNYRVISAGNGDEVVRLFREHANDVRLVITDNMMPGMTGLDAIARLRKINPSLPVIIASGEELEPPAGASVLKKPFPLDELLAAVQRNLRAEPQ
jgi:two-component system cell cycle sensor histidine kinase/response regulator CckA